MIFIDHPALNSGAFLKARTMPNFEDEGKRVLGLRLGPQPSLNGIEMIVRGQNEWFNITYCLFNVNGVGQTKKLDFSFESRQRNGEDFGGLGEVASLFA